MCSVGVILYGPPASGKDTITAELRKHDSRVMLYRRLKIGPGRTAGYRMTSVDSLDQMAGAGDVIYLNHRYAATYVIDRPELASMLEAGLIPVVHVGQPEALTALQEAFPEVCWTTVELWSARGIAERRINQRRTGDAAERLAAWDETQRLIEADLRIDTGETSSASAADLILRKLPPGNRAS